MVWFQCEACGEELKKPKLPNHFRQCSAYKLSCIDCGVTFDKQTVQSHTQCITEAEKYGPKGQGKVANGTPGKPNKEKAKPDVDINVGLSDRPPWFCSLCNTQATSKQTLLLHADGKKHRAKARARAAAQRPKPSEESAPTNKDTSENASKNEFPDEKSTENKKENGPPNGALGHDNSVAENGNASPTKKRKIDSSSDDGNVSKIVEETPKKVKKAKHEPETKTKPEAGKEDKGVETSAKKEGSGQKMKLKKLITTALKSTPDRVLKMKKLRKLVMKSLKDSGILVDDSELSSTLEQKVNSSSKYTVDGKYIRLAV